MTTKVQPGIETEADEKFKCSPAEMAEAEDFEVTITVPGDFEKPKFRLFQDVVYHGHVGLIVGMDYMSAYRALKDDADHTGWSYTVCFATGTSRELPTPKDVLNARPTESYVDESDLEEWNDG